MNKHDELLRKIENTPEDENLYWIDQLKEHEFVCTTDELQSLAADFRMLQNRVEHLESVVEMYRDEKFEN